MSLYIKDAYLPDNCYDCDMLSFYSSDIDEWHYCAQIGIDKILPIKCHENRLPNCPLIEIPESHGDLIDRDYLLSKLSGVSIETMKTLQLIKELIETAPAVIEKE